MIVLDPDDGELYWGNLTEMVKTASGGIGTVPVSPNIRLTPDGLEQFLEVARLECSARRSDPLLNLTSADPDLLQSALFDCLALGRRDPRYLTLVRCSLSFIEDQRSFYMAINLLAHATPHPDILWHHGNYIPDTIAGEICKSYRWTPSEIAMILARLCLPEAGNVEPGNDWTNPLYAPQGGQVIALVDRSAAYRGFSRARAYMAQLLGQGTSIWS